MSILRYEGEINFFVNKLKFIDSNIIIYGWNDIGQEIYKKFKQRVVAIVDKNHHGSRVDSITIDTLDSLRTINDLFIITSLNKKTITEIKTAIQSKFSKINILSVNDFYFGFSESEEMPRCCPICKTNSNYFKSFGYNPRQDAQCPSCGSLERHRLSWLFMKDRLNNIKNKKFLHIAPEPILQSKFSALFQDNYITADISGINVDLQMDITNIKLPDQSFDYIYCSHVLEHIIEDKKAMKELNRVLKNDGWAILLVPITSEGKTEEDFSIVSPEERLQVYGHPDHVRNYGYDYVDRLIECGWKVETIYPVDFLTEKQVEQMGLTKAAGEIYFCTKN